VQEAGCEKFVKKPLMQNPPLLWGADGKISLRVFVKLIKSV
jgi:hypothetical protein